MSNHLRTNNVLLTVLILLCMWSIESAEVRDKQEFVPKLFGSGDVTSYSKEVITSGTRGITITILETNMQPALKESALKSLTHYAEIYRREPEKVLWETAKDMNRKHSARVWLGAVNFSYVIAIGPYISVDIDGDRIFMFGVLNC